ncbi:unnamed protein product [Malus baccata var. baccata]
MTTRFQSGAIPRKVCSVYVSILPELQSLQLNDDDVNYGDDIILTGSGYVKIQETITQLSKCFELKDKGRLTYFLGLHIQYKPNGELFISQSKYAKQLIKKVGMESCKSSLTPSKPHTQLLISEGTPLADPSYYRNIVGALQYLTFMRPNIAFSSNVVCQFMNRPINAHLFLVKRILRQQILIQDVQSLVILYSLVTIPYLGNRKISHQCHEAQLRLSSIRHWKIAMQMSVGFEIYLEMCMSIWMLHLHYTDNIFALVLRTNLVFHPRIKHMDTDYHFVRERVLKTDVTVHYILIENQVADVLIKGLHSPISIKHCHNLILGYPR